MRTAMLAAAVALMGTACYQESVPDRYYARDRDRAVLPENFDAYTTNGSFVRVHRDQRTGDLLIVAPEELHGQRVALVSATGGQGGAPLVTSDVRGSGGDQR